MAEKTLTTSAEDDDIPDSPIPGVKRPIFLLGIVSFFTDVSSEMIYPLIPLFLTAVVGAPVAAVGVIEGVAESTASLSKLVSGWASDHLRMRKPLVILGYGLSAIAKPLLALASAWPMALGARFTDRLGKGVRTAPRDALMADVATKEQRGRAFGFHRALDSAGAVVGPAIGLGLFELLNHHYRLVFVIAFIPAAAGVIALMFLPERKPKIPAPRADDDPTPPTKLGHRFYIFLGISLLFAFGNSSDAFLILRSENLGLGTTATVSAYILYNAVYTSASFPAGIASDRVGRRNIIVPGFAIFALVYLGFGIVNDGWYVWPLFAVYGLYIALTDAVGKAWVIDFAPPDAKATAVGLYTGATGAMVLVASIVAGVLWDEVDPAAPFILGAVTGLASAVLVFVLLATPVGQKRDGA
ncbi:MAG: MFS transporter [Chloroflexota bacterium]